MDADKPSRILVYEDDPGCAMAFSKVLRSAGYEVWVANHFEPALRLIEGPQHPVLIVADIAFPQGQVSGVALGRMARMKRHGTKLLYVTGYDIPCVADVADVLRKPVSNEQLISKVRQLLAA